MSYLFPRDCVQPHTKGRSGSAAAFAYSLDDPARAVQWRAFVRRSRFSEESGGLVRLVTGIRQSALPVLSGVSVGNPFKALWKLGGPWE
jgi:hypothetical protein